VTDDRLIELIESWGADPSAFPQAERGAARALLAAHPERFAPAIAEARALDAALARMPDVFPPPALTAALIASAPKPKRAGGALRVPKFAPWAPASGAAALAAGLFMGLMAAPSASADSETDDVQALLEEAIGYDPAALSEGIAE
jgi:hypothetical protein